jgi:hypothetical protein
MIGLFFIVVCSKNRKNCKKIKKALRKRYSTVLIDEVFDKGKYSFMAVIF